MLETTPHPAGTVALRSRDSDPVSAANITDAQAVLLASRALVAVAAKSLAQIENVITAMQWRVLVVISRQRGLALNELAAALGVHPSTGTRLCDQLIAKRMLSRRADPMDRRYVVLQTQPVRATTRRAGQR